MPSCRRYFDGIYYWGLTLNVIDTYFSQMLKEGKRLVRKVWSVCNKNTGPVTGLEEIGCEGEGWTGLAQDVV
jgi:hypothetical protein